MPGSLTQTWPGLPPFNSAYTLQEALTSREQIGEAQAAPAPAPGGPRQRASSCGPCFQASTVGSSVVTSRELCPWHQLPTRGPHNIISASPGCWVCPAQEREGAESSRVQTPPAICAQKAASAHSKSIPVWQPRFLPVPAAGHCERGQQSPALWAQDGAVCEKWLL